MSACCLTLSENEPGVDMRLSGFYVGQRGRSLWNSGRLCGLRLRSPTDFAECLVALNLQLDDRSPSSALILRRFGDGGHVRMLPQILPQGLAQDAHAAAV